VKAVSCRWHSHAQKSGSGGSGVSPPAGEEVLDNDATRHPSSSSCVIHPMNHPAVSATIARTGRILLMDNAFHVEAVLSACVEKSNMLAFNMITNTQTSTGNPPYSTSPYSYRYGLSHGSRCGRGVIAETCRAMAGRLGVLAPLGGRFRLLSREFAAVA
jgi:hypothetical protein